MVFSKISVLHYVSLGLLCVTKTSLELTY